MACHCPHIQCFDCDEYSHVAADCPDKIPPSGTLARHKKHHSNTRHCTRSTFRHHNRDRHRFSRSRSQSHTCRYRCHSHKNLHRSCSRSYHRHPHRSISCHQHSSTYHYQRDTPPQKVNHHIEVPPLIPEIATDLDHVLYTDPAEQHLLNLHPVLTKQHHTIRIGKIKGSPFMMPSLTTTVLMAHPVILMMTKLKKACLSNAPHEWGGPLLEETIKVACIMDSPTITVHAGKWYKALIDSGAAISLLRYSAYNNINDCYKNPHTTHHSQVEHSRWLSNVSTRNDSPTPENC